MDRLMFARPARGSSPVGSLTAGGVREVTDETRGSYTQGWTVLSRNGSRAVSSAESAPG